MKKILFIICLFTLFACNKEGNSIWRVWYIVELPSDFDADIVYNSDLYVTSGQQKTINITDENYSPTEDSQGNKFWQAQRIQSNRDYPYSIDVIFNDSTTFVANKKYVIIVGVNDTTIIDSIQFFPTYDAMHLSGEIPLTL